MKKDNLSMSDYLCPLICLEKKQNRQKLEKYEKLLRSKLSIEYLIKNLNDIEKFKEVVFNKDQKKIFDLTYFETSFINNEEVEEIDLGEVHQAFRRLGIYKDVISKNLLVLNNI
jgi:hypothetical protein